jgi:tetratricopeptide (TPR) repeat protein
MKRLVADRLWPVLVGLAALLAGALALQGYASRRGNEPIRIVIQDESAVAGEDEDSGGAPDEPFTSRPPVSEEHTRARMAAKRAEFKEALPIFEKLVASQPGSASLAGEYGYWLTLAHQREKALPFLEKAEELQPSAYGALRLGLVRSRLGDREGAEQDLRRALEQRPGMTAAHIALGNLLRKRGALNEAIEHLQAAASAGSNQEKARALVALGAAQLAAGKRPEAERSFERAIQFAPARAEVRVGIARAWLDSETKEDAARAVQVLTKAAVMAPDVATVHGAMGRAREKLGDAAAAREAYERALRIDPGYRYVRRRLLRVALATRDFQRARSEAAQLIADAPDEPEHHFLAALVAEREGRADEARRAYRKAIEVAGGDYPEAYLNLGVVETTAGNLPAAQAALERALEQRRRYPAAWLDLGNVHAAAGRPAKAEAAFRKAIEQDPHSAAGWLALGQFQAERKSWAVAIDAFKHALEARPGDGAAQLSLARALSQAGRRDEAIASFRGLLAAEPRHVGAWYDLAAALLAQGRAGEARAALGKALEVDRGHLPSLRELAELDLREGRAAEARKEFEEILDLVAGDLPARAALAEILSLEGDRAGCEARARSLRAEAPADDRVQRLAAACASGRRASNP